MPLSSEQTPPFCAWEIALEDEKLQQGSRSKGMWMWHLGTWFSGGHDGDGLRLGLNDFGGFFQPQ